MFVLNNFAVCKCTEMCQFYFTINVSTNIMLWSTTPHKEIIRIIRFIPITPHIIRGAIEIFSVVTHLFHSNNLLKVKK